VLDGVVVRGIGWKEFVLHATKTMVLSSQNKAK